MASVSVIALFVACLAGALYSWYKGGTVDALAMLGLALIVAGQWSEGLSLAGMILVGLVLAFEVRRWVRKRNGRA
jgi:hypothetical protein